MRIFVLLSFLLFSAIVFCEETQTQQAPQKQEDPEKQQSPNKSILVYPKELLKPLPEMPIPEDSTKVFVEVEKESHPAIEINLPTIEELLYVRRSPIRPQEPMRGQEYYQRGGGILSLYGVHESSGQLFNVAIPVDSDEEKDETDENKD